MGMAASQARLLALTARKHDVEFQAQSIQNAKIQLATKSDQVYQEYLEALDATVLTVRSVDDQRIAANFNNLCGKNAVEVQGNARYAMYDERNRLIVDDNILNGYKEYLEAGGLSDAGQFAMYMMGIENGLDIGEDGDVSVEDITDAMYTILDSDGLSSTVGDQISALQRIINDYDEEYEFSYDPDSDAFLNIFDIEEVKAYCLECAGEEGEGESNPGRRKMQVNQGTNKFATEEYQPAKENKVENSNVSFIKYNPNLTQNNDNADSETDLDTKSKAFKEKFAKDMEEYQKVLNTLSYKLFSRYAGTVMDILNEDIDEENLENGLNSVDANNKFDYDTFNYYSRMFQLIQNSGSVVSISSFNGVNGNAASDGDWLQSMIQSGRITIELVTFSTKDGSMNKVSDGVSSDTYLDYTSKTTVDKKAVAKAEAEYEHKMSDINKKDKRFDLELSKLETEREALTTEYESVKKVIKDNIEKSFGIFS